MTARHADAKNQKWLILEHAKTHAHQNLIEKLHAVPCAKLLRLAKECTHASSSPRRCRPRWHQAP
eukprot:9485672-Alexandrium_andersonii.AAC.1